jgi:hypothetical protein
MDLVAALLTTSALVVAWVIFRLEREGARRRDIAGARATLIAVQRGVVEGMPELGPAFQGWGSIYFSRIYDFRRRSTRGSKHERLSNREGPTKSFQCRPNRSSFSRPPQAAVI